VLYGVADDTFLRFLRLWPVIALSVAADKLSLVIELPHQPGALHSALEPFARRDIDLLKIEGRPVKGRPWEYCFYLDVRGSANDSDVIETLAELQRSRRETRIRVAYRSAVLPNE